MKQDKIYLFLNIKQIMFVNMFFILFYLGIKNRICSRVRF